MFQNFDEYKHKVFGGFKNTRRKHSVQVQQTGKENSQITNTSKEIDPLNITFNKASTQSAMKDCPYKNKSVALTNPTSASTKKRESATRLKGDMSIDPPNFRIGVKDKNNSMVVMDQTTVSKSDLTTPNKHSLLLTDKVKSKEVVLDKIPDPQSENVPAS